ncbi:MAG: hypothetical protein MJ244_02610 [Clostridia bacterium]|nr:hypothetical protein [Clostridia bacterium]
MDKNNSDALLEARDLILSQLTSEEAYKADCEKFLEKLKNNPNFDKVPGVYTREDNNDAICYYLNEIASSEKKLSKLHSNLSLLIRSIEDNLEDEESEA